MRLDRGFGPRIVRGRQCAERRKRRVQIAGHLGLQTHRPRDVDGLDVYLQQGHVADPCLVFDLDRVVAEPHYQVGIAQECALHLAASALDAADAERMVVVDHPFRHRRRRERHRPAFDEFAQEAGIPHSESVGADDCDRTLCLGQERGGGVHRICGGGRKRRRRGQIGNRLVDFGERDILGQVEMDRPHRFGQRDPHRLGHRFADGTLPQRKRFLGDGRKQLVMIDIHLDAAAELLDIQVAGDRDHGRSVEPRVADAGCEIRRPGAEGRNAESGRARHAAHHVGSETGGSLMRGQDERQVVQPHRLHQRQDIAARYAEPVRGSGLLQYLDDKLGVVHGGPFSETRG